MAGSATSVAKMASMAFLGGDQMVGEDGCNENNVLKLGALRNATENYRKPRKPEETHRKPPETAPETVRFRGSLKRNHMFLSYPGINLYY